MSKKKLKQMDLDHAREALKKVSGIAAGCAGYLDAVVISSDDRQHLDAEQVKMLAKPLQFLLADVKHIADVEIFER